MAELPDFLKSFDAWVRYQYQRGENEMTSDLRALAKAQYQRSRAEALAHDARATVRGPWRHGHFRYAVAIEDSAAMWLTLWVKRSPNGECFIIYPRGTGPRNPHSSYHVDGHYHQKTYGMKLLVQQRQPIAHFRGSEHLGSFSGHGVGMAVCYPEAFTSVIRVPKGVLEATHGSVLVDLVEPGRTPNAHHREVLGMKIVAEQTFRDCSPWVVIAVAAHDPPCAPVVAARQGAI